MESLLKMVNKLSKFRKKMEKVLTVGDDSGRLFSRSRSEFSKEMAKKNRKKYDDIWPLFYGPG